jgi:DNA-binding transcriptional regulator GbsR (MarR family)
MANRLRKLKMKPKIKHPKLDPKKNPELDALAHLVGDFIEYWGFKSVQGRMWCYLFLIEEPLNSRQLAQLLRISPALVTQSIQVLLRYRVIMEAEKGKNGVLRFRANPNVAEAVSAVLANREMALIEKIKSAQKDLYSSEKKKPSQGTLKLHPSRPQQLGRWVVLANLFLKSGIQSLNQASNPFEAPEAFEELIKQGF